MKQGSPCAGNGIRQEKTFLKRFFLTVILWPLPGSERILMNNEKYADNYRDVDEQWPG
jgi:hypothetical protein